MHLQRRAIARQKVGFLHFLLFQIKNYKYGTTSRVSKQANSESQRNREPVYKCSEYSSELSRVFEINIAKDLDTVHPSNFCKPFHTVVHT